MLNFEIFLPADRPDLGEPGNPKNNIIRQRHQNKKFEIIPQKNEIQIIPLKKEIQIIPLKNEIQIIQLKNELAR